MKSPEDRLRESWIDNADPWTEAVREGRIASRRLVTDEAIVAAALECGGSTVLDIGCGEGWLARRLSSEGRRVTGFDATAALVRHANDLGLGSFMVASYESFVRDPCIVGRDFDVAVANFSLFVEDVSAVLAAARRVVATRGVLLIQTVHPSTEDADGWKEERYAPLAPLRFTPMPWYFRTLPAWLSTLEGAGWPSVQVREPIDPRTGAPASLILIAKREP